MSPPLTGEFDNQRFKLEKRARQASGLTSFLLRNAFSKGSVPGVWTTVLFPVSHSLARMPLHEPRYTGDLAMTRQNSMPKRHVRNLDRSPSRGRRSLHQMDRSLERLEHRLLLSASQQLDATKLAAGGCPLCGPGGCRHTATAKGATLVACNFNVGNAASAAMQSQATVALAPLDQTFQLASRPSATKTIYLDFTGHTTDRNSLEGRPNDRDARIQR